MTEQMVQTLLRWYEKNRRDLPWREAPSAYHVWISEIMLQQTRVEAVKRYYTRFLAALPALADLAEADDDRLMKLWEGLGYYSRAANLKKAAQQVMREHGGVLPSAPEQLLDLPGIGLYTAGAIASIAYGIPVPAVDGNVLRVLHRLHGDNSDIALEKTKRAAALHLLPLMPQDCPGTFNQALMELGACVCLPNGAPRCADCPLAGDCIAYAQNLTSQLPVKSPKKPRKVLHKRLLILRCGDQLALCRRPAKGLLAGLWELPEAFDLPEEQVVSREPAGEAVHIFTHIEWHMTAERVVLHSALPGHGLVWVTQAQLEQAYAVPSAFSGFREWLF